MELRMPSASEIKGDSLLDQITLSYIFKQTIKTSVCMECGDDIVNDSVYAFEEKAVCASCWTDLWRNARD